MQPTTEATRPATRHGSAPARPVEAVDPQAELRGELLALNELLRERKSVDHAARAYFGSWGVVVSASVATKLYVDSVKTPWVAVPLAFLALVLLADVVSNKRRQWKLNRVEQGQLLRQRELRRLLGLEEAVMPSEPALTLVHPIAQA